MRFERSSRRKPSPTDLALSVGVWLLMLVISLASATAGEVRVLGAVDDLRVEARQATVSEILSALRKDFGLRYRSGINLDARVDGSYSGSLKQVLARLLDGYSYVIKNNGSAIEIVVIGRRGDRAIANVEPVKPAPPSNPTAQWRSALEQMTKTPSR